MTENRASTFTAMLQVFLQQTITKNSLPFKPALASDERHGLLIASSNEK